MELKYDIYTLNNAQGTGEKRQYVRIAQHLAYDREATARENPEPLLTHQGRCGCGVGRAYDLLREEFSTDTAFTSQKLATSPCRLA